MKKILLGLSLLVGVAISAQIEGKWKTIDDETGKAKSIVEISKKMMENTMEKSNN